MLITCPTFIDRLVLHCPADFMGCNRLEVSNQGFCFFSPSPCLFQLVLWFSRLSLHLLLHQPQVDSIV